MPEASGKAAPQTHLVPSILHVHVYMHFGQPLLLPDERVDVLPTFCPTVS